MKGLQSIKSWIGAITEVLLMLIALAIVVTILLGSQNTWIFSDVVANLTAVIQSLGNNGLAGLIALAIIMWLFQKRSPA